MSGVNKVILVGYVGADPEYKTIPSGQGVANFNVATSESYKDAEGKKVDKTEWHRIVAWEKLAQICKDYLHKGSLVFIEGKLQTRSWDDEKSGQKRYMTEIRMLEMKMLGPKPGSSGGYEQAPPQHSDPYSSTKQSPQQSSTPPTTGSNMPNTSDDDDDLPF